LEIILVGRVLDAFEKTFTPADGGKDVTYARISVFDEDAFLDTDRVFVLKASPEVVKTHDLVGKYWKFTGILTKEKGEIVVKVSDCVEPKTQS
jgi:hypothetical protein